MWIGVGGGGSRLSPHYMWTHRALWEVCCFPGACPPNAAHSWPRSVVVTAATRTCLHCCGPVGSRKWWDILCGVPAGVAHLGSPGAHCNDSSCRWLGLEEEDAHSVLLFWVKGSLQSTQCRMILLQKRACAHGHVWSHLLSMHAKNSDKTAHSDDRGVPVDGWLPFQSPYLCFPWLLWRVSVYFYNIKAKKGWGTQKKDNMEKVDV